jgi:hypothetical protein
MVKCNADITILTHRIAQLVLPAEAEAGEAIKGMSRGFADEGATLDVFLIFHSSFSTRLGYVKIPVAKVTL